jgi:hypothetical protein
MIKLNLSSVQNILKKPTKAATKLDIISQQCKILQTSSIPFYKYHDGSWQENVPSAGKQTSVGEIDFF